MSHPLAITTPAFGVQSQTFVRRHVEDLLPGRTVVVADTVAPGTTDWRQDTPRLVLSHVHPTLPVRVGRAIWRRSGGRVSDWELSRVSRFLRERGVHVVLGEHLDVALRWLPVAQALGIRFFAHAHGYDVSLKLRDPSWREAYRAYNSAAGVITISEVSRARLLALGLDPARVHVAPCGVDVPDAPPSMPDVQAQVRCLAVGRLVSKKAPILLLDAFRRAQAAMPGQLHLDLVGDGPLMPAVRQFVQAFGMDADVTIHGARDTATVMHLIDRAHIFLHHGITSEPDGNEEGLPVVILEAMAHARPVVSTRHAGIPEAVIEGETGLLVNEGDTKSMAAAIADLARDPHARTAMGTAGWSRARNQFTWRAERAHLLQVMGLAS